MKNVLNRPEISDRLAHISIKLGDYDIKFHHCTTIKAQAIVDFMVECPMHESVHLEGMFDLDIFTLGLKSKVGWKV